MKQIQNLPYRYTAGRLLKHSNRATRAPKFQEKKKMHNSFLRFSLEHQLVTWKKIKIIRPYLLRA